MRQSKLDKQLDREITRVWTKMASGVQVSVMDIPAIFKDARAQYALGVSIEAAMPAIIERYRRTA